MRIENLPTDPDNDSKIYFCVPAYVIKTEEFTFQGGEKRALKMIIDIDGNITEVVRWPDYDTGELIIPEGLKKGAVAYFFMKKTMNKTKYAIGITDITVEKNI